MIPSEGTHAQQIDPVERRIWRDGVELLTSTGGKEREVRSLLGQLAKTYGAKKLADAIVKTRDGNPADPRSYLVAMLRGLKADAAKAFVGRSHLPQDVSTPECGECSDLQKIWVPRPDAEFSFEMLQVDCPHCAAGKAAPGGVL